MERSRLSSHLLFGCICLSLAAWLGGVVANESTLTVDSVQLGLPISSIDGEGAVDGSVFSGDFGEMTISVDSNNPTGYMSVWMQVNVSGASVSDYEWEIVGWKDEHPYGELSYYDAVIDIDPELEIYRVQTVANTIRYDSTTNSLLSTDHVELIKVTAWATDGNFSTAHFHLTLSPAQTSQLADLFFSAGFAPSSPNSTLIVQVSDIHVDPAETYFPTPTIDDRLVNGINGLEFLPDELVVSGDIAHSRSPSFGMPRTPSHELLAREEMEATMVEMQRFDSRIRQWIVPGNHDTDAQEIQPELWSEITGYPAFQRADMSGVPVFLLNGRHSGDFDAVQLAWLEAEFTTIADDQDIVVFVHQPSLWKISVERGIKRELVRLLAGRRGRVWVFSGHIHEFNHATYVENGTQFVQTSITTGNSDVFNDGKNPGYALIGLQDGDVVFRIFKDVKDSNYELVPPVVAADCALWFDLGSVEPVSRVEIAWFRGDQRRAVFDLEYSMDDSCLDPSTANWSYFTKDGVPVIGDNASGDTTGLEPFELDVVQARCVRYTGYGAIAKTSDAPVTLWNSINEFQIFPSGGIPGIQVNASDWQDENVPSNAIDDDFDTHWVCEGGKSNAFVWPYEDVEFPVLIRDEGTYSRDDYLFEYWAGDTGTWLAYVRDISWKLPLSAYSENVNEVLILGGGRYVCEFSPDGVGSWQSVGTFQSTKNVFRIPIPVQFIGTDVFFRATNVQESVFAGWGLSVPFPEDSDGDGIHGWYETTVLGTDPNSVDSDSDGLVDGAGGVVDMNDYPGGGGIDIDGDGFVDGEQDLGTDPTVSNFGDLAPRTNLNNIIDLGDLLMLTRLVTGSATPSDLEMILGDINGDTLLNAPDILLLQRAILTGTTP